MRWETRQAANVLNVNQNQDSQLKKQKDRHMSNAVHRVSNIHKVIFRDQNTQI